MVKEWLVRGAAIVGGMAGLHYLTPTWRLTETHPYYGATGACIVILAATQTRRRTWIGFALAAISVILMHEADTRLKKTGSSLTLNTSFPLFSEKDGRIQDSNGDFLTRFLNYERLS